MPMLPPNAKALPATFDRAMQNGRHLTAVRDTLQYLANSSDVARLNRSKLSYVSYIKRECDEENNCTPPTPSACSAVIVKTELPTTPRSTSTPADDLDDSLTNLQWLQAVSVDDILEGKSVTYAPLSPAPSSCSDDGKENDDKRFGKRSRDLRHSYDSTVDYRLNPKVKPPYSYAALIIMAMKANGTPKMTLSEIYRWISENFVYFKFADPSWQNSIRHNLSLNKCFTKMPRKKGDPGKGGYWCIVPEYANKLLENSFRKRRASMVDYNCLDLYKRQKLDNFENRLLGRLQSESSAGRLDMIANETDMNNNSKLPCATREAGDRRCKSADDEVFGDLALCQLDHSYGREPLVQKAGENEADHIRAIAENLQFSTTYLGCSMECSEPLSSSQVFNTFANFMRSDCCWSSEVDNEVSQDDCFEESMQRVTEELLEARNVTTNTDSPFLLSKSLGGSCVESPFLPTKSFGVSRASASSPYCLSPPLSGDDVSLSDDDDTVGLIEPVEFSNVPDLTIRGVSVRLHEPTPSEVDSDLLSTEPEIKAESRTTRSTYS